MYRLNIPNEASFLTKGSKLSSCQNLPLLPSDWLIFIADHFFHDSTCLSIAFLGIPPTRRCT